MIPQLLPTHRRAGGPPTRILLALTLCATLAQAALAEPSRDRNLSVQSHQKSPQVRVNCDRGQRLARALSQVNPGTTINIRGTCYEQINIVTDDVRLRGVDGAVIDGDIGRVLHEGTVTIDGAQRIRLESLEVRNGPDQGVVVTRHASAILQDLDVHGHQTTGIVVDGSYAELSSVDSHHNGIGFDFFSGAIVIAKGPLSATDNGDAGVAVNAQSILELRGAILETSRNGGDGITLVNDSELAILSFPEAQGSGVTAAANGGAAGLFVANSHLTVVGSTSAGSGANQFDISGHGVGMLFIAGNFSMPFATGRFNISNNGVGVLLTDNTDAYLVGGLNVTGNQIGILGDGAGVVRIQDNASNPSSITGNVDADVLMGFGSRIDLKPEVSVGVFVCDPTVLTAQGSLPCP